MEKVANTTPFVAPEEAASSDVTELMSCIVGNVGNMFLVLLYQF